MVAILEKDDLQEEGSAELIPISGRGNKRAGSPTGRMFRAPGTDD